MKIDLTGKDKSKKTKEAVLERGSFESLTKRRKQDLPKVEESINDILKDFAGENITIIKIVEDENGLPTGHHVVMAGTGRAEASIAMALALNKASKKMIEMLVESADGNTEALVEIAKILAETIKEDE